MRKYLSTLLVASVLIASCSKDAEVIREKIVSQSRPILSGQGQPDNGKGEDGDYYLDLKTAKLYGPKTQGAWGEPSLDLKGLPGTNGITPTISEDGYWVIDGVKTSTKAQGDKGQDGRTPVLTIIDGYWAIDGIKTSTKAQGERGQNGHTPVFSVIDGYWAIDGIKTSTKAQGERGQDGHTPVFSVIDGYWAIDGVKTSTKAQGERGQNGHTPVFSVIDGYWAIDGVKTSTKAQGDKGQDGRTPVLTIIDGYWAIDGVKTSTKAQGERGQNGHTPIFSVIDGYWAIDGVKTTTKAQGEQGTPGQNGTDGSKILAEDRAPQATDGVKGDYFIDKTAKIFYGPKTDAGWPTTGISLVANQVQAADYQLSEDGKTLVKWLNPKTSYIDMNLDPNLRDVTTIATGAFAAVPELRDRLSTIVIGDDVTEIQASAFHGCGALRRVELPEGLTAIAPNTFEGCISLQYINIPETVTSIGMQAFANCVKLKKITIPKGVGRFESRTFFNCTALKTLVLESPIAFNIDQVSTAFSGTTLTTIFVPHAAKQAYKDANRADRKAIIKSVVIE